MNISEQIATGVSEGLSKMGLNHPLLSVVLGAGITTPEQFRELKAKADKAGEAASAASAEDHPVLKVALAAGIDNAEKFAQLSTEAKAGREAAGAAPAEEHPVLKAALAADCDTAAKFTTLAAEAQAGREALPGAREDAKLAAVAYFGTDAAGLKAANELIEGETSFTRLSTLSEKYWAGAPGSKRPEQRLSQANTPSAKEVKDRENNSSRTSRRSERNAGGGSSKHSNQGQGGGDIYASYNGPHFGAGASKAGN